MVEALVGIGSLAVADLTGVLRDQGEDENVRIAVAETLGQMGSAGKGAIPALTEVLKNKAWKSKDAAWKLYKANIGALEKIAEGLQDRADTLKTDELKTVTSDLEAALKALNAFKAELKDVPVTGRFANSRDRDKFAEELIANIRRPLEALKLELENRQNRPIEWIRQNQAVVGRVTTFIILVVLYLGILWQRPLWLLKLNDLLEPAEFKLPFLDIKLSPRALVLLKFHPRVLDAWVAARIKSAQEEFERRKTVEERKIYIFFPVVLDGKTVANFTAKDLQPTFTRQQSHTKLRSKS